MAQPGSAPALGAGGRRFESGRPDYAPPMIAVTGASGGIGDGSLEPVSDTVERIAPRSLGDVLREHPESAAHLQR